MNIKQNLKVTVKLILIGIVICSLIYPLAVGVIGQLWSNASRGSLIKNDDEIIGSELIGQQFNSPRYFHSRPSSIQYDASRSASANWAPNNPKLKDRVEQDLYYLANEEGLKNRQIPADLITESGSALDPHISPEAAFLQIPRIAENTGLKEDLLKEIVKSQIKNRLLGLYGQKRVNVLQLNLQLDEVLTNE